MNIEFFLFVSQYIAHSRTHTTYVYATFLMMFAHNHYFVTDTPLFVKQKSYCQCLLQVTEKEKVRGPYRVCTAVKKGMQALCSWYYNYKGFTNSELVVFAVNVCYMFVSIFCFTCLSTLVTNYYGII